MFADAGGGDAGHGIHACRRKERQPWSNAVQKTSDGASRHGDGCVTPLVEAPRLGIIADIDDRAKHRIRSAPKKSVDAGCEHRDQQQHGERQRVAQQQHRNRAPSQNADDGVRHDKPFAVMPVDEGTSEYARNLLRDHRRRSEPPGGDGGAGHRISEQTDRQCAQRRSDRRRRIGGEPRNVSCGLPE